MKKTKILLLSVLAMLVIVSSCKKEDPINEAQVLIDYVEANVAVQTLPGYIGGYDANATDLGDLMLTGDAYIIDIRSAAKYTTGHIAGAVNVDIGADTPESVVDHVMENETAIGDKTIVIVCYSGQSAAWAGALCKLAGYSNVKSLKFGMSGWLNAEGYDSWTGNVGNAFAQLMETTDNPMGGMNDLPEINTGFETGEEILIARIKAVEAAGFGALATTNQASFDNKDSWYIMNYWGQTHYETGHIPGAMMYDPGANPFTLATDLKTIPVDGTTAVVYCYTGQTSSWVSTYLNVLGYTNVKTLKFGANGMFEETMPGTRWLAYKASHPLDGAVE